MLERRPLRAAPLMFAALLLVAACLPACARSKPPSVAPAAPTASSAPVSPDAATEPALGDLDRALVDLRDKQVVLLGESGGHDSVRAWETKAALILRLIDECGFGAVFVESAIYEFLALGHAIEAGTATAEKLADAFGEFWSRAEELQPWFRDLFERAASGRVTVAGLTAAVHTTAHYARGKLPAVLAGYLPKQRGEACEATLDRHLNWRYDDAHPYNDEVQAQIRACADGAKAAIAARSASPVVAEHLAMATAFSRSLANQAAGDRVQGFNARDAMMYEHFVWHRDRLPADARIIVWCATVHAAVDLSGVPGFEGFVPLGAHIHKQYGERAAAVGFSAYAGTRARIRQQVAVIEPASPGSIEAQIAPDQNLRYFGPDQLRALGEIEARGLNLEKSQRARWSDVIDGLIVFREERAPNFIQPAK